MILFCDIEQPKKIYIKENKLNLLKESLSSNVYHFTNISSAYKIIKDNEMFCQNQFVGNGADSYSNKYGFYISLTRTKSSQEGFGYHASRGSVARIEFDGDKLNQNFHGEAINYWGGGEGLLNKFEYMRRAQKDKHFSYKEITDPTEINTHEFKQLPPFNYIYRDGSSSATEDAPEYVEKDGKYYRKIQDINPDVQHHVDNEIEDRLFTNKEIIDNIRNYIKRVDIFVNTEAEHANTKQFLSLLCQIATKYSQYFFIYDNLKDFDNQSENTINQKYIDLYSEYGQLTVVDDEHYNIRFLADLCSLITFFDEPNEQNKNKAILLKKYGLESLIRRVLSERPSNWGLKGLIETISIDSQNVSKRPSKTGQKMLRMLNDFMYKNGYKSFGDAYQKMDKKLKLLNSYSKYDWDSIDTQTMKEFKVLNNGRTYWNYVINNDEDTDFWFLFDLNDKWSKYNFIENLIWSLENNRYGDSTYLNVIRGGDLKKFEKYLKNLAHKQVTLNQMFGLLKKIGLDPINVINDELGCEVNISTIESNYWNVDSNRLRAPYNADYDENDNYIKNLFKKEA